VQDEVDQESNQFHGLVSQWLAGQGCDGNPALSDTVKRLAADAANLVSR
jgi:hypothetical protein